MNDISVGEITLCEFDKIGQELIEINSKINSVKKDLKELGELKDKLMSKIIVVMGELGKTIYQVGDSKFILKEKTSVRIPSTEEDKEAFFSWLKSKGIFKQYVNVNSVALNALYKQEREAAIERGDFDFKIPGIGGETIYTTLSITRS